MTDRKPSPGATRQQLRPGLRSWLVHHRSVALQTLKDLADQGLANFLSCLVIGIAMALPTLFYLTLINVAQVSERWDGQPRLSLYLSAGAKPTAVLAQVSGLAAGSDVDLISSEDALMQFASSFGFSDVLLALDDNPLPAVIEVRPEGSVREVGLLIEELSRLTDVDEVTSDIAWIERLNALVQFGEYLVIVVGLLLAFGVTLSIGNTIRLSIENRRAEILVVKLVGGTDAFVRRPFLYLGLWYGLGGAVLCCLMLWASMLLLQAPLHVLIASYEASFSLRGLLVEDVAALVLIGVVLGIMGASLSVGRHLRKIEPQ